MNYLKQSTSTDVPIGPFLDQDDGKTAEVALTITQPDVRLKKNGGAWAQKNAAQTLSHEENGWYELTLDATDTDTIGHLVVAVHESGALPVWREFHVLAANVYDSLFGAAADKLDVNVEEWNATAVPAEHTAGYPVVTVKDGTGTGEINTNAGKVAGVELVDTLTTYTGNTPQTGDSFARLGAPAGASVSADLAALNDLSTADVDARLAAIRLDELLAADSDIDGAAPPTVGSVFHELMSKTASSFTYDQATDSLEALRDRGDAAWATATSVSVAAGGITSASFTAGAIDAAAMNVTGSEFTAIPWNASWDAEVQSEVQDAIEANHLDHLLAADYDPAAKPGAATALLNELVESDAGVSRYTANALEQAPSGGGGAADWTADERTAIRAILGVPASGTTPDDPTAGILDTIRDRAVAVEADTQDIQSRLPAALVSGRIDASVGAMAADALTASALAADAVAEVQSGLSTLTAAQVTAAVPTAAQNADALLDRADAVEVGLTPRGAWRLQTAVLAGKASGGGTGTEVFRNAVADTKARVTAVVDNVGNRTAITWDAS